MKRVLAGLLAVSCASPPAPPPTPAPTEALAESWLAGHYPEGLGPETHRVAVAADRDPGRARTHAATLLERALYGPETQRPFDALPPILAALLQSAVERQQQLGDAVEVLLAVNVNAIPEALARWRAADQRPPMILHGAPGTEQVAAATAALGAAEADAFACAMGNILCDPDALSSASLELAAMASRLKLTPVLAEGLPFRPGGAPLRPLQLRATWQTEDGLTQLWPGLSITCAAGGTERAAVTDAFGIAQLSANSAPVAHQCWVDRSRLLGRHRDAWPRHITAVSTRELVGMSNRVALELRRPSTTMEISAAVDALTGALTQAGFTLVETSTAANPGHDVLVRGEIRTFADGRPTDYTFCYRARATVELIDAWRGQALGELDESASKCEIGADNASGAALVTVGEQLAAAVGHALGGD